MRRKSSGEKSPCGGGGPGRRASRDMARVYSARVDAQRGLPERAAERVVHGDGEVVAAGRELQRHEARGRRVADVLVLVARVGEEPVVARRNRARARPPRRPRRRSSRSRRRRPTRFRSVSSSCGILTSSFQNGLPGSGEAVEARPFHSSVSGDRLSSRCAPLPDGARRPAPRRRRGARSRPARRPTLRRRPRGLERRAREHVHARLARRDLDGVGLLRVHAREPHAEPVRRGRRVEEVVERRRRCRSIATRARPPVSVHVPHRRVLQVARLVLPERGTERVLVRGGR